MKNTKTFTRFFAVVAFSAFVAGCADCDKYVDDSTLSNHVQAAIQGDPSMLASQLHVETDLGVVQLTGSVDSVHSEARAVEIASDTFGTMGVVDGMRVRWYRNQ